MEMNGRMQGAVAAVTLALAIVSAVGLAAMGLAGEDHVVLIAASATARLMP
jgi:hypothetical protein